MRALQALSDYQPSDDDGSGRRLALHLKNKGFEDDDIKYFLGSGLIGTIGAAQFMWLRCLGRNRFSTPEHRAAFEKDLMSEVARVGTKPLNGNLADGALVRKHYEHHMRENLKKLFGEPGPARKIVPFRQKTALTPARKEALLASLKMREKAVEDERMKLIDPPF